MHCVDSYLIAGSNDQQKVIFLVFTEKSYPKRLAYNYLEELCKEFQNLYSNQIEQPTLRPYAFIKFGTATAHVQPYSLCMIDSQCITCTQLIPPTCFVRRMGCCAV